MGGCGSKDGASDPQKGKYPQAMLKSSTELVAYESFFHKDTKSALSRHLSKEIWEEYKDQSDDCGVTFKTMVFSGIKNQDSGIGLYAGSHGSYTKFEKLFDAVMGTLTPH